MGFYLFVFSLTDCSDEHRSYLSVEIRDICELNLWIFPCKLFLSQITQMNRDLNYLWISVKSVSLTYGLLLENFFSQRLLR